MWGAPVQAEYSDIIEFVGLCDINPGRVAYAKEVMKVNCRVYTDFDQMIKETEKPFVINEKQCQNVLDAEKRTGNKVIVTFNARYGSTVQKIWEILRAGDIGTA